MNMKLRILLSTLAFIAGPAVTLGLLWCDGTVQRGDALCAALCWSLVIGGIFSAATWHQLNPNP